MKPLLFDGAMGTYLLERWGDGGAQTCCLTNPSAVEAAHRAYIEAGAEAIKTNSFGECTPEMADAAWRIASRAAEGRAAVFADIGPGEGGMALAERFIQLGARRFLLETFPDDSCLAIARHIKALAPDAFIIVSFAADPSGFTRAGEPIAQLMRAASDCPAADVIGLNCVCGPHHILKILKSLPPLAKPLCAMPNSGYPETVGGRTYFAFSPQYFARQMAEIARYASWLGGCCGTTPEYIREAARAIQGVRPGAGQPKAGAPKPARRAKNAFVDKLDSGACVIAVELDPPQDANAAKFLKNALFLRDAGADAITLADCPIARVRADSSMLAAKLKGELGVDAIPHMTCRDRNLNATRALLLGLEIAGIANVLAVTGDPLPSDAPEGVKGVFNYNSKVLASYIRALSPLSVHAALNVNAVNFEAELGKARQKQEAGVSSFFTQPIATEAARANLRRAREALSAKILGGILPVVSHKNALFLHNEVPGMRLAPETIARYEGLSREDAQALAIELCADTMKNIRPYVDGYYLMTPFGRVEIIRALIRGL